MKSGETDEIAYGGWKMRSPNETIGFIGADFFEENFILWYTFYVCRLSNECKEVTEDERRFGTGRGSEASP